MLHALGFLLVCVNSFIYKKRFLGNGSTGTDAGGETFVDEVAL